MIVKYENNEVIQIEEIDTAPEKRDSILVRGNDNNEHRRMASTDTPRT